ncbi:hypothetical protein RQP46_008207 [Phenoliferia psychrophenolica]
MLKSTITLLSSLELPPTQYTALLNSIMDVHSYIACVDGARPLSISKESDVLFRRHTSPLLVGATTALSLATLPDEPRGLIATRIQGDSGIVTPTQASEFENASPALSFISAGSDPETGWQWHHAWGNQDTGEDAVVEEAPVEPLSGWKSGWGWTSAATDGEMWNGMQPESTEMGTGANALGLQVSASIPCGPV